MKFKNLSATPPELRLRCHRLGKPAGVHVLDTLDSARSPWAETAKEIQAGLRRGAKKERQLAWVRSQMLLRLTKTEQECITLYYFRGLNYRQAGTLLDMNASSVYRAARRGILKLKEAARESGFSQGRRKRGKARRR